ncbi:unnamed protein product [Clonostachys solani]|uniref:Uncharacterized protein n=1 Tax=Clonostachys solani TaxID=160281 RepID=A0A9N9ZJP6_9HYPO|nr:unnamed protein product [Clonostachys solani]
MAENEDPAQQFRANELRIEKEPYTDGWLLRWLTCKPLVPNRDGSYSQYRGWSIAPPHVQIYGIQDMIRNQNRDPISDWKAKTFDCFRYLVSLDREADGDEPWYTMLQNTLEQIKPFILITTYEKALKQAQLHSPAAFSGTNRFAHLLHPNHPLLPPSTPRRGSIIELLHDAGIVEDEPKLPRIRSKLEEAEVRWMLTAISKRCMEQQESQVASKRDRAIQEYRESLAETDKGEPVMPLPRNWNGPVELSMMDEKMKQTWDTLREHQKLAEQLEKADGKWRQRPLITEIKDMIEQGRRGVPWPELDLQFGDYEFLLGSDGERELRLIAPEEASWLWYLSRPLYYGHMPQAVEQCDRRFDVFWRRIRSWLKNYATCTRTFHTNQGFLSKQELIQQFNTGLRGPVKKWRLGQIPPEVWRDTDTRKVLQGSPYHTHYAVRAHYPERTIRWPNPPPEVGNGGEVDGWEAYKRLLSQAEDGIITAEELAWQVAFDAENGTSIVANHERQTERFFRRLAYRLGHTIRVLKEEHKQDMETLESQGREEASRQSLARALEIWRRARARETDTPQEGSRKRRRTSYRDIVREHVPDRFQKDWDDDPPHDVEAECAKMVGEEVLGELHDDESHGQEPRGKKRRREALWTFGHSSMKPRARKFWDINRWGACQQEREQRNAVEHAGPDELGSLFYGPQQPGAHDDDFYADSASRTLPRADMWQNAAEVRPEIFEAEEVDAQQPLEGGGEEDGQQPQEDGEDNPPAERTSWLETVMGNQNPESGHSRESGRGTEQSGHSNKENVGQRTLLPSPDDSPTQGGMTGGPLQDVTHIHEPGAGSEPDLYGRSEDGNEGPRVRDQHSSFSIFEDGPSEQPSESNPLATNILISDNGEVRFSEPNWTVDSSRRRDSDISPSTRR